MELPVRIAALLLACSAAAAAQDSPSARRPRIGLALGGGNAKGFAHVGVLRLLEEQGLPVDVLAGTSMGAVVGSLWASGYTAAQIEAIIRSIDWGEVFSGRTDRTLQPVAQRVDEVPALVSLGFGGWRPLPPDAAFSSFRIEQILTRYLTAASLAAGGDFDRLPVPFRAVAADLRTGERVVLGRGSLPAAVRASLSLPVLLPPVRLADRLLVDGALVDNLPVDVVRTMGADVVIAVDLSTPPDESSGFLDSLDVVSQLTDLLMASGNRPFTSEPEVRVHPKLTARDAVAYADFERLIRLGREAGEAAWPLIADLAGTRLGEGSAWRPAPEPVTNLTLAGIRVEGLDKVRQRLVLDRLGLRPGQFFDLEEALRGLDAVWATGLLSSCRLEALAAGSEAVDVVVRAREKARLRAELGLGFDEADNARGFLRLRNLNLFGMGERLELLGGASDGGNTLRLALQGVGVSGARLGYRAALSRVEQTPRWFDAGRTPGRARFRRLSGEAALQRALGSLGLVDLGLEAGSARIGERAGIPFEAREDMLVKATVRVVLDGLDDLDSPERGARLDLRAERTLEGLGSSRSYFRASAHLQAMLGVGLRHLLEAQACAAGSGRATPEYDLFRVGGPQLIPGREREELWGRHVGAASLAYGFRLTPGLRLGLRVGAGGAWLEREAIRAEALRAGVGLELALATPLGAARAGLGFGAGRLQLSLSVGPR